MSFRPFVPLVIVVKTLQNVYMSMEPTAKIATKSGVEFWKGWYKDKTCETLLKVLIAIDGTLGFSSDRSSVRVKWANKEVTQYDEGECLGTSQFDGAYRTTQRCCLHFCHPVWLLVVTLHKIFMYIFAHDTLKCSATGAPLCWPK